MEESRVCRLWERKAQTRGAWSHCPAGGTGDLQRFLDSVFLRPCPASAIVALVGCSLIGSFETVLVMAKG